MTLTQSEKIDRDIFGGIEDLYPSDVIIIFLNNFYTRMI